MSHGLGEMGSNAEPAIPRSDFVARRPFCRSWVSVWAPGCDARLRRKLREGGVEKEKARHGTSQNTNDGLPRVGAIL